MAGKPTTVWPAHRRRAGPLRGRDPQSGTAPVRSRRPVTPPYGLPAIARAAMPSHGVGSRQDLPLPFDLLLLGAAIALILSFVALGALWKAPRLSSDDGVLLPAPLGPCPGLAAGARLLRRRVSPHRGLDAASPARRQGRREQPRTARGHVWMWSGLGMASMLLGPFWRVVNPIRWLHLAVLRLARVSADFTLFDYRLGFWPQPPACSRSSG